MKKMKNVTPQDIMELVQTYIHRPEHLEMIEKAMAYATRMHDGQFRKSGEPYVIHVYQVAYILAQLQTGPVTIAAGLLHDVIEDCEVSEEEVTAEFGSDVVHLVESVTKIGNIEFKDEKEYMASNHRKILIAMAKDIRVILIKLVDRLHNMRTLEFQSEPKQHKIAEETLQVYAPIAHRLGISEIKNELEDLCFYYLNRDKYYEIAKLVDRKQSERLAQVDKMMENILSYLEIDGIKARVFGRSKHLYSIYKKMVTKNKRFDEILDLLAIRIVTETETNCYEILGVIHSGYKPIPGRFKDYIAMPKMNMYQSLHTTIVGEDGEIFEVQIRTEEMDSIAERGIAAHWSYKEGKSLPTALEQKEIENKLAWMREIVSIDEEEENSVGYMNALQKDIFEANVYVMSPKGRVIDLPNGATPLDFAYRIHTEIGHATVGATINGVLLPLNTPLKTGDVVSIRTSKQFAGPSEDWLKIVKTSQAKNKIRSFLAKKETEVREKSVKVGETMLRDELRRRGHDDKEYMDNKKLEALYSTFAVTNYTDFMYAIASKSLSTSSVIEKLVKKTGGFLESLSLNKLFNKNDLTKTNSKTGISVTGVESMMINLAGCCNPIPGDPIVGYISKGNGVKVHRMDCPNVAHETARLIDVFWDEERLVERKYRADLLVSATDRNFLLSDIVTMVSQCKSSITTFNAHVENDKITAIIKLTLNVDNLRHLQTTMANLKKINSVVDVERIIH